MCHIKPVIGTAFSGIFATVSYTASTWTVSDTAACFAIAAAIATIANIAHNWNKK